MRRHNLRISFWAILAILFGIALSAGFILMAEEAIDFLVDSSSSPNFQNEAMLYLNQEREDIPVYQDLPEKITPQTFINDSYLSLPKQDKFILADLDKMTLSLFQAGRSGQTFNIVSVGKPGKPWETPRGIFQILHKTENHLSSITQVWMPYSLQFLGNYFIHGWPYYRDGTLVPKGFSGGCIRLETADAKQVFLFAERGTPLWVKNQDHDASLNSGSYISRDKRLFPDVSAESYLVADLNTGEILVQKNSQKIYPLASITKLLTALVALDQINPIKKVTIRELNFTLPYEEVGKLKTGESVLAEELLWPLLLESSNKSAYVLANDFGLEHFVRAMNQRALAIGLLSSKFVDPAGIGAENVSTAEDIFRLARHIFFNKNYLWQITREEQLSNQTHVWANNNPFVGQEGFLGGKSGKTSSAKESFVNLFEVDFSGEKRNLVLIVLRSDNRELDVERLLTYIAGNIYLRETDKDF